MLAEDASYTTASLAVGNYTSTEFTAAITSALNSSGVAESEKVFATTYSETTGKFTITYDGTKEFTFNFTNKQYQMGFDSGTVTSSSLSVTGDNVIDLSGPRSIVIHADFGKSRIFESRLNAKSDVVCVVPMDVAPREIMLYEPKNSAKIEIDSKTFINFMNIRVTDTDGTQLDLNGVEWEMSLMVEGVFSGEIEDDERQFSKKRLRLYH